MIDEVRESASGIEEVLEALRPEEAPSRSAPLPRNLPPGFGLLLGVGVSCSVELGSTEMEMGDVLGLGRSALIVLDRPVDRPVVIKVNGVPYAQGRVVEVDGRYGVRVTEVFQSREAVDRGPDAAR